jgi:hypothetical protein
MFAQWKAVFFSSDSPVCAVSSLQELVFLYPTLQNGTCGKARYKAFSDEI